MRAGDVEHALLDPLVFEVGADRLRVEAVLLGHDALLVVRRVPGRDLGRADGSSLRLRASSCS